MNPHSLMKTALAGSVCFFVLILFGTNTNAYQYVGVEGEQFNCGDGICQANENYDVCELDCPSLDCGDGQCSAEYGENNTTCGPDCPFQISSAEMSVEQTKIERILLDGSDISLSGDLQAIIADDFENGRSEIIYSIKDDSESFHRVYTTRKFRD